ncbi:MAG: hypothetical protein H7Y04_12025 [Verrucomicrobia bacterium]|nr:hypothetical protein [Cytophagales bacterium]
MSRIKSYTTLFCLFITYFTFAGGDPVPVGGRSWGMANTFLTLRDPFALFNNPAGLSEFTYTSAFATFDSRYGVSGLQYYTAGFVMPVRFGTFGVGFQRFGNELYNEQQIGLAFGKKIDLVSLGAKVNLLQIGMDTFGAKRVLTFEFGAIAEIIPKKLLLGAKIHNLTSAKIADYQDERVPTVMSVGFSFRPTEKLMLNAETEKDIDFPAIIKAGLEYEIVKNLKLRTGISSKPYINYFGIGFSPKSLQFDYAVRTHPQLGLSHQISVLYRFREKTKSQTPQNQ